MTGARPHLGGRTRGAAIAIPKKAMFAGHKGGENFSQSNETDRVPLRPSQLGRESVE